MRSKHGKLVDFILGKREGFLVGEILGERLGEIIRSKRMIFR